MTSSEWHPVMLALAIAVAGGVGAAIRHLIDSLVPEKLRKRFPWGIMLINLSGSFALGLLVGAVLNGGGSMHPFASVIAIGLLGGYTTFSTASLDTVRLLRGRRYAAALLAGPGMLVLATACAVLGIVLARG